MKIRLIIAVVTTLACSACAAPVAVPTDSIPQGSGTIEVSVSAAPGATGKIHVALFDSQKHWLKQPAYTITVPVHDGVAHAKFTNVAFGLYAASAYLDQNGNNKLDTGAFHIPQEPVGCSNNAKGSFGPPSYSDARFSLKIPVLKIKLNLS